MKRSQILILAVWLIIILAFWLVLSTRGLSATAFLEQTLNTISERTWGPLVLLGLFLLRPLLLLPITILNVFAGFLFGPVWGFVYAMLATLLSSTVAYIAGRYLGLKEIKLAPKFLDALRSRSFETVLMSRLIFLPGDLVNYAAGFLKISYLGFIAATALGGAAGLLMVVLVGASIEGQFSFSGVSLNPWYLLASAGLLIFSLGLSSFLRRRTKLRDMT